MEYLTGLSGSTETAIYPLLLSIYLFISPRGMDGVADGDNVSRSGNIQVRPREGDEARVSHSVLVPT